MISQAHLPHPKYRPDIDGLRAIAVVAVVLFHAFPSLMKGGFIGVDIFFVISGYLVSTIIFESLDKGNFSFIEFYVRRINRIFPALILVLISCFVFGWFALFADEFMQLGKHIMGGATFISNFILWKESSYFDNFADTKPLLHLWSLGVEEQFYIVWPVLLWCAYKMRFNLLSIATLIALVSFFLNIYQVKIEIIADFYSPQTRFWELMVGAMLAWLALYKKNFSIAYSVKVNKFLSKTICGNGSKEAGRTLTSFLSVGALLLLAYGFLRIDKNIDFPGKWALIPVLSASLLIFSGPKAWVNRTLLSNRIAIWLGLVSFPLYLWHWPLLSFARIVEGEALSFKIRVIAVVLSILLAWITYKFLEQPIRLGNNSRIKAVALFALMAIVGFVGYNTFIFDGYEFRDSIRGLANNKNELIRTPASDQECLNYVRLDRQLFPYCKFTNADSNETIAVIGDSHAHVAYPGIAEFLKEKGINTVLLANSSCPPFLGSTTGANQTEKDACSKKIEQLLSILGEHKDIKKVFIFSRGPIYNYGTAPVSGNQDVMNGSIIPIAQFAASAQLSIDRLSMSDKTIFYVTENPELDYPVQSCIVRPFKPKVRNCSVEKLDVLMRQKDYLKAFNNLKNVTVINSLSAFCPDEKCSVFDDNGYLLYADDNHLSVAGSRFQVHKLLKPFLM